MTKRFLAGVLLIVILYTVLCLIASRIYDFDSIKIKSIIFSGIISTVNIVAAFFLIKSSMGKSAAAFNKAFLSGMAIKFFLLLMLIFLVMKFSEIHQFVFLLTLFLLYFIFQFWEIIILNKNLRQG